MPSIPRSDIDRLIEKSGLRVSDNSGYTKVGPIPGSARRIYVAKTRQVQRIDLSGFMPPSHPAISIVTPELRRAKRIAGGVMAQIDFSQPTNVVLDAIRVSLAAVAGAVSVANVAPRSVAAPAVLALAGYAEPPERRIALRFFSRIAEAAIAASINPDQDRIHLKYVLDKCIWGVTTCSDIHKYNPRYVSSEVRELVIEWSECSSSGLPFLRKGYTQRNFHLFKRLVRHEHVVTRKSLLSRLRAATPLEAEELLAGAEACLVTIAEDRALNHDTLSSWARYSAAGIRVWDRLTGDWKTLPSV
jgi:hypothetical protein